MTSLRTTMPGGERKLATMLFVDLSGFTELSLREDPEDVRVKIKPLFDGLVHIAELHGGWVSQVEGDGFLALFGVPSSRDDDPVRAVSAAQRMRRFCTTRHDDLAVHMGLATGEVFSDVVRGNWAVNGPAVNLASRLCDAAGAGEIFVDQMCAELAGTSINWSETRVLDLKGHRDPVEVRVLDAVWEQGAPRIDSVELFGRDAETRLLDRALEEVATTGRSKTLLITGEAGVGKTALVSSWGRHVGAQWLYGRSRGAPFDVPFDPLSSALRELPALGEASQVVSSTDVEGGRVIAPWWELVLGAAVPERTHEGRDGVLAVGFKNALRDVAKGGIVVLCLDDLHNSSSDIVDWLLELEVTPIAAPVLVLATARERLASLDAVERIHVGSLDLDSTRQLLAETTGHAVDAEIAEQLLASTGGNPLFIRESASLLESRGEFGKRVDLPGSLERAIPDSVRLVLAARLDALAPAEKWMLQAASIWGEEGPGEVLGHLLGTADLPVIDLRAGDGLFEIRGGRWHFTHSLVRDVAYASLPKRQRATLHEALLNVAQITQAQRAFHSEAVMSLDVAADAAEKKSVTRRAASEVARHIRALFAVEASAARDAVHAARRVIESAGEVALDDAIHLLLIGSAAAAEMGDFEGGAELAGQARALSERTDDRGTRAASLVALGRCLSRLRRLDEAATLSRQALDLLDPENLDDLSIVGRAHAVLGETYRYDSFASWVAELDLAYEAFHKGADFDGAGEVSRLAAYVLSVTPGPDYERWSGRARAFTESDDLRGRAWIARAEMFSESARGNAREALEAAGWAKELALASGLNDISVEADQILSEAGARCGEHANAVRLFEDSSPIESLDPHRRVEVAMTTALGLTRAGAITQAFDALDQAETASRDFGNSEMAGLHLARADSLYVVGRFAEARASYDSGRGLAQADALQLLALSARLGSLRCQERLGDHVDLGEVLAVAEQLASDGVRGYLDILLATWPAINVARLPGPLNEEAFALDHESAGDWKAAADAWAVLGVSEDLARALERAGQTQRAADVRAILRAE